MAQALASLCPPAGPYNAKARSLEGSWSITHIGWDGARDGAQVFADDEVRAKGVPLVATSVMIFDIKLFDLKTKRLADYGFAIYPLTRTWRGRLYVPSGV